MPLVDLVHAFQKAIPSWDPAKHPRDRDGQFIEVGDLVRAYESKEAAEPEAIGRVHASYFAPDGRMFIGVESYGYVRWYRPKQLEHAKVKATLKGGKEKPPELPIPSVDEKYDEVFWQNDDAFVKLGSEVQEALDNEAVGDLTLKKSDLDQEFLEMAGLSGDGPAPSTVPQQDEVKIPAGKTPDDLLGLIAVSYKNKGVASSLAELEQFSAEFQDMLDDPEFKSAADKLSKIMTKAKLGGKQRKRYNSILAQKYGGHQAASFTPVVDEPLKPGVQSVTPEQAAALRETLDKTSNDERVTFADQALQAHALFGEGKTTVIASIGEDGALRGAAALIRHHAGEVDLGDGEVHEVPGYLHLDYLAALEKGAGKDLLRGVQEVAQATGVSLYLEATQNSEDWWAKQPYITEDPDAVGAGMLGWNQDGLAKALAGDPAVPVLSPSSDPLAEWEKEPLHNAGYDDFGSLPIPGILPGASDAHLGSYRELVKVDVEAVIAAIDGSAPAGAFTPHEVASAKQALAEWYWEHPDADQTDVIKQALTQAELNAVGAWFHGVSPASYLGGAADIAPDGAVIAPPVAFDPPGVDLPYDDSIIDLDTVKMFLEGLKSGHSVDKVVIEGPGGPTNWNPTQVESAKAALYEYGGADAIPETAPQPDYDAPEPEPAPVEEPAPVWFSVADDMASNSVLYAHPQGSILISYPSSGTVVKYNANGKKAATSATFEKLLNGHGQWTAVGTGPDALIQFKESQLAPGGPKLNGQLYDDTIQVYGGMDLDDPDSLAFLQKMADGAHPNASPEKQAAAKKVLEDTQSSLAAPTLDTSQHEVLNLLGTSFENKHLKDTSVIYPGGVAGFKLHLQDVLDDPDHESARKKLAKLMTVAKLGGKQRKRYNDALAAKFGAGPVAAPTGKGKGFSGPDTWAPLEPSNSASPTSATPAGVTGPTKGNALVNPSGSGPQNAKATIQEQLSKRLKGRVTIDQLTAAVLESKFQYSSQVTALAKLAKAHGKSGGISPGAVLHKGHHGNWSVESQSYPGGKENVTNPTPADWERAILETVANSLIGQWAGTSNDNNARALAMQLAAAEEFGLKDTYTWPASMSLKEDTKWELNKHRELYRAFLREMYNNTQEWAKQNGVTKVRLRRGSGTYVGPVGSKANAKLRPMSSFSSNYGIAAQFGSHRIEAYVPIEWVVGNAATGYGCQGEYEWIVLGGVHKVKVIQ